MDTPAKRQRRQEGDDEDYIDPQWFLEHMDEFEVVRRLRQHAAENRPLFV
jgi:hypothetical protein